MIIIDEKLARRAKEMNSMFDYQENEATNEYSRLVNEARELAEEKKKRVDARYHEKIDYQLGLYERKLAENINKGNAIDVRCPSMLIAGPVISGYRKDKQNAAREKNNREYIEIQQILDKICGVGTAGISGDDPDAAEKIREKIEAREALHETMKKKKCQAWELANNRAEIRRLKARLVELEQKEEFEGWTFEGGEVVINREINRLQIKLDAKPDDTSKYKIYGFRWSPREKAWQRQLTANAVRAAKQLTSK